MVEYPHFAAKYALEPIRTVRSIKKCLIHIHPTLVHAAGTNARAARRRSAGSSSASTATTAAGARRAGTRRPPKPPPTRRRAGRRRTSFQKTGGAALATAWPRCTSATVCPPQGDGHSLAMARVPAAAIPPSGRKASPKGPVSWSRCRASRGIDYCRHSSSQHVCMWCSSMSEAPGSVSLH